jgi:NADPH-dependent 2,4-dienoyl-CoA reductase/sulfur reductase-like enzyme/rhodanese-related sulfurtransferase
MKSNKMKVVIIGGVATGPKTAARLRRLNPEAEITIIERGKVLSYAGCGLPYFVGGDIPEAKGLTDTPAGVPRDSLFFQHVKGIQVIDRTLAEAINRQEKTVNTVHLETGEKKTLLYEKLVLATGGLPIPIAVKGMDLHQVYRICLPEDAIALREAIFDREVKNAVIIGAGLIGMEMAEAFVKQGVHVSIVEMMPQLLPGILDVEMAAYLMRYVREQGIEIFLNTRLTRIVGDDQGNPIKVETSGSEIPVDMVVIAVGVRPNSKLAEDAGLEIGPIGDIKVNEYLQTSDPNIYSGGDCVRNIHRISGKFVFAPMGSTANKHGRIIANNLMGYHETFKGVLGTSVVKVFRYSVGKTGLTETQAREAGYEPVTALVPSTDVPHYYPTSKALLIKMIADRKTRKILGLQAIGPGEVAKRIDVLATSLNFGATIDDLPEIDLGYAPPYSTAIDIVAHAANILRNKIEGTAQALTSMETKSLVDHGEDFIWLDVRSPEEIKRKRIDNPRVKTIPLGLLRRRLEELSKDKKVVTLCKAGLRAYEAQTILKGSGFKDVQFLDGGIEGWPYELSGD